VRAVEDALRVLGEVVEPGVAICVARVADEAVGLGEGGGPDEAGVDLHGQAVGDAGAALDAGHRLGDIDHGLFGDDVLALGHGLLGEQPGSDALDLLPVHGVHVDDEVLDDGHVAHGLDLDDAVLGPGPGGVEVVWQRARFAVDAHAAGAADGLAAGAADADGAVEAVARLQDRLEDERWARARRCVHPVGGLPGLGVVPAHPDGELLGRLVCLSHQRVS